MQIYSKEIMHGNQGLHILLVYHIPGNIYIYEM